MTSLITTAAKLACIDIYDPITPNIFHSVFRVGETTCGVVLIDKVFYIVCQGTENKAGWEADFDALPITHPILGNLHSGFYENLQALAKLLLPIIPENIKVVLAGHSKGAGEASILAALLHLAGVQIEIAALFACPNSGNEVFSEWLNKNIKGVSYRNAPSRFSFLGDPVPLVPPAPFKNPYPHTTITAPPKGLSKFVSIEWHSGELYEQGVAALNLS